jgi:hypothetical protein
MIRARLFLEARLKSAGRHPLDCSLHRRTEPRNFYERAVLPSVQVRHVRALETGDPLGVGVKILIECAVEGVTWRSKVISKSRMTCAVAGVT